MLATLLPACNGATERAPDGKTTAATKPDTAMVKPNTLQPKGPKPEWGPTITDRMQAIIEKLMSYGGKPVESLSPMEARRQPTPTNAVMDLVRENNVPVPPSMVDTMGKEIPVAGGQVHARVYMPKSGAGPFPIIVYYRGGGWVIASLDVYDASCRGLAEQTNAVVVSVDYRMGPEHKFPTAHNDAFAAYQWVLKNAATIKGDPKRVAVAGESAGGNLAANVCIMARDKKVMIPLHEVLVYPVVGDNLEAPSVQQYQSAKPLNKAMLPWFFQHYLRTPADGKSPLLSLDKANLKGLPPATIIAAEIDPLTSGGELLADKLKAAGVPTTYQLYKGVTHEFFGMAILLPQAKDAQALAVRELKKAFGN
ncbi:MAG: alpha/beta hydrolase [Saprospiraceae bacterium]